MDLVAVAPHEVDVLPEAEGDAVGLWRHVVGNDEDAQVGLGLVRRSRAEEPCDPASDHRRPHDHVADR